MNSDDVERMSRAVRFEAASSLIEAAAVALGGEPGYMQHVETLRNIMDELEIELCVIHERRVSREVSGA